MPAFHLLKDCGEIDKMLNALIKSLSTLHSPLSTYPKRG